MAAQVGSREASSGVFGQPRGRSGWSVHKNYRKSELHVGPKWFEPIISQVICMSQKQLLKLKRKHIKLHFIENSFGPIISLLFWTKLVGRQFCLTPPITNGRLKWPIFSHFSKIVRSHLEILGVDIGLLPQALLHGFARKIWFSCRVRSKILIRIALFYEGCCKRICVFHTSAVIMQLLCEIWLSCCIGSRFIW